MREKKTIVKVNILYRICYGRNIVYLGRTRQKLQDRIRGHLFKKPMHRSIDIDHITKIEYAECKTEADMFLYEIYYINTLKPPLNVDDRAGDDITVVLPELKWQKFECHLMDKWREEIHIQNNTYIRKWDKYREVQQEISVVRRKFRHKEMEEDEYELVIGKLAKERNRLYKEIYGGKSR